MGGGQRALTQEKRNWGGGQRVLTHLCRTPGLHCSCVAPASTAADTPPAPAHPPGSAHR
jgi:hypothetical protein